LRDALIGTAFTWFAPRVLHGTGWNRVDPDPRDSAKSIRGKIFFPLWFEHRDLKNEITDQQHCRRALYQSEWDKDRSMAVVEMPDGSRLYIHNEYNETDKNYIAQQF
jgi:hypothetical protein